MSWILQTEVTPTKSLVGEILSALRFTFEFRLNYPDLGCTLVVFFVYIIQIKKNAITYIYYIPFKTKSVKPKPPFRDFFSIMKKILPNNHRPPGPQLPPGPPGPTMASGKMGPCCEALDLLDFISMTEVCEMRWFRQYKLGIS